MKTQPTKPQLRPLPCKLRATLTATLFPALILLLTSHSGRAGSATWNLNPTTGDWNTAANWTPATVPNGAADVAGFGSSSSLSVSLSHQTQLNGIVFNPGASAFTISADSMGRLTITGSGITNNSGLTQDFIIANSEFSFNAQVLEFDNNATAGKGTNFTNDGSIGSGISGGWTYFSGHANADHANFTNNGGTVAGTYGGALVFNDFSSASGAMITNNEGTARGAYGGRSSFVDRSSAGNAIIINNGGAGGIDGGNGGYTEFYTGTSAGEATLIAQGGTDGSDGGVISFWGGDGGAARVELLDYGTLHLPAFGVVSIGSLEGNGIVLLEHSATLSVGASPRSTTFSGVIKNGINDSGGLVKVGSGDLTLSGTNSYEDGTVVTEGGLVIDTTVGSGTGTGRVEVTGGRLGGRGTITGDVTIGSGSGPGALLMPAAATNRPATLHVYGSVTFKSDSTYASKLHPNRGKADSLLTNGGVTIESGAVFSFVGNGSATITPGTVFTIVRNNAATRIVGTFSNLPDGGTIKIGNNTFLANYEGGDGNDLTLTVVP